MLHHLAGIREELHPIAGQSDPFRIPDKDFNPHLIFQVLNGIGKAGLRDEELFCGLIHRAGFDDFDNVL